MPMRFVLTLSCPDRIGIVHAVSGFLASRGCNIVDSHQFGDRDTGRFFMRVAFETDNDDALDNLTVEFGPVGGAAEMEWSIYDASEPCRILVMVSKFGHCLNDLLYRTHIGALPVDIVGIVSNHHDFAGVAESAGLPFHHIPVAEATKNEAEVRLIDLVRTENVELVVLARYMQVLSDALCATLPGRIINIHHSFLPGFKGAKPYHQAHDRGVKLIGATAHYVTPDLDEGPIIEQEVGRVDHSLDADELVAVGRDLECQALSRAVLWHAEHRILLNGTRTVIFR
jgi:formyltetrahydrofolate deformylase